VADLHRLEDVERAGVAARARLAGGDRAEVGPEVGLDVAFDVHAAQVVLVFVGAGRHAAPAAQRLVGDDAQLLLRGAGLVARADAAEAPGRGAEQSDNLFGVGGAHGRGAERVGELRLVQRVVAAQEREHGVLLLRRAVGGDVDERLDLAFGRGAAGEGHEVFDGADAGRRELLGGVGAGLVRDGGKL
jgi:hypothetical protein